jgi:hypothetical protein
MTILTLNEADLIRAAQGGDDGAYAQLAFGAYGWSPDAGTYLAHSFTIVTLARAHIAEATASLTPDPFPALGPPETLDLPPEQWAGRIPSVQFWSSRCT